ncbi:MAG: hypothetical protein Q4D30_12210 [Bacteroidales bacterium]|nr:hypothetical protein [Bacteroidales bacterium]
MEKLFRFKLTFVLLLLFPSVQGQNLSVVSITEESDSTALINPIYDINGNICAKLIIHTNHINELLFSGMIIGDVHHSDSGEYVLSIPNQTKRIQYRHADYFPGVIDFSAFSIQVIGGKTYTASLKEEKPEEESANKALQYLTFKSNNQLESIIVNGKEWPIMGGKARKMVGPGLLNYTATDKDGRVVSGNVNVNESGMNKTITIVFD